jgi:hypothetical protein
MKMSPGNERSTDAAGASTSSVTTPSVRTVMCSSSIAARAIRPSVWRTSSTWATAPITWPPAGSGTWPLTSWGPLPPVEDSLMVIVARSPLRSAVARARGEGGASDLRRRQRIGWLRSDGRWRCRRHDRCRRPDDQPEDRQARSTGHGPLDTARAGSVPENSPRSAGGSLR